jgi:nucleotide-binding universal stress UspA family protein
MGTSIAITLRWVGYKHILCPVDTSPAAWHGLRLALYLQHASDCALTIVAVPKLSMIADEAALADMGDAAFEAWSETATADAERALATLTSAAVASGFPAPTTAIAPDTDSPAESIRDFARDNGCDLIVMGTSGRRGFLRLLHGSVAQAVMKMSHVPVFMAHEPPP